GFLRNSGGGRGGFCAASATPGGGETSEDGRVMCGLSASFDASGTSECARFEFSSIGAADRPKGTLAMIGPLSAAGALASRSACDPQSRLLSALSQGFASLGAFCTGPAPRSLKRNV